VCVCVSVYREDCKTQPWQCTGIGAYANRRDVTKGDTTRLLEQFELRNGLIFTVQSQVSSNTITVGVCVCILGERIRMALDPIKYAH